MRLPSATGTEHRSANSPLNCPSRTASTRIVNRELLVDPEGVEFCDSTGLATLIGINSRCITGR